MSRLKFRYQLTRAEIEEALLCLDYKKEGKFRDINVGLISLIGVGALIAYVRNSRQFFWIILLGVMVLLLLYIVYVPAIGRKRRAKKIAWENGTYSLELQKGSIRYGDQNKSIEITKKNAEAYISEKVYVLRINREVFTIPKRIMKEEEKKELEQLLKASVSRVVRITLERGEKL